MTASAPIQALAEQVVGPDKLVQIVRPFVGTGRSVHRGDSAIDVLWTMNSIDVAVIAVDASGLLLNGHDGFRQVIPWAEVRSITVRGMADDESTSAVTYVNACALVPTWRWNERGQVAA